MSTPKKALLVLPTIVAVGFALALVVPSDTTDEPSLKSSEGVATSSTREAMPSRASSWNARSYRSLGRRRHDRPSQWQTSQEEDSTAIEPAPPPEESDEVDPDPEVERAAIMAIWQDQLDGHQADARDHSWATSAESGFIADLSTLRQGYDEAFEVLDVDCRSQTCLATLDFSSFGNARSALGDLLQHPYEVNCATATIMPDPEDPDARYVGKLLFDCTSLRSL